jgi:hypothetical protein
VVGLVVCLADVLPVEPVRNLLLVWLAGAAFVALCAFGLWRFWRRRKRREP